MCTPKRFHRRPLPPTWLKLGKPAAWLVAGLAIGWGPAGLQQAQARGGWHFNQGSAGAEWSAEHWVAYQGNITQCRLLARLPGGAHLALENRSGPLSILVLPPGWQDGAASASENAPPAEEQGASQNQPFKGGEHITLSTGGQRWEFDLSPFHHQAWQGTLDRSTMEALLAAWLQNSQGTLDVTHGNGDGGRHAGQGSQTNPAPKQVQKGASPEVVPTANGEGATIRLLFAGPAIRGFQHCQGLLSTAWFGPVAGESSPPFWGTVAPTAAGSEGP
ncbi:hypothetical protein E3E12_07065 [Formicincola oecophyllae]|uniref:Uncharacterized protein n=1 Tax=Formicincola oecophyllae TaxID=2558361 RepID=A0A4Y6UCY6_9PROT|nr:hypothetical protein [Formicincola oecophyllae]QDH13975.1 hypothetical protein E3E12_07065 [Formicincola oecophyllae]